MTINFKKSILYNIFCIFSIIYITICNFVCPITVFFKYTLKKVTVNKVESSYNMQ